MRNQKLTEVIKPNAVFRIDGFNVGINDGCKDVYVFNVNCNQIENVSFALNDGNNAAFQNICIATVTYEDGTEIDASLLSFSQKYLEKYFMIFAIEKDITVGTLSVNLDSYTVPNNEGTEIHAYERIGFRDELSMFPSYGSRLFENAFSDALLKNDENTSDDFQSLKLIFDVSNVDSRYLLQYEFLKHLVAELNGREHGSQKQVQKFIVDKYNPVAMAMDKVSIRKSLLDPNEDQDSLTFYRNVIGHPAVTETEKEVLKGIDLHQTIIGHSKQMNKVILYAIREKARLNGSTY